MRNLFFGVFYRRGAILEYPIFLSAKENSESNKEKGDITAENLNKQIDTPAMNSNII